MPSTPASTGTPAPPTFVHNTMSSTELNKFIDLNLERLNRLKIRRTHVVADSLDRIKSNSIEDVCEPFPMVPTPNVNDLKVESAKLFQKISNSKEQAGRITPSFCRSIVNNLPKVSKPLKMKINLFK